MEKLDSIEQDFIKTIAPLQTAASRGGTAAIEDYLKKREQLILERRDFYRKPFLRRMWLELLGKKPR